MGSLLEITTLGGLILRNNGKLVTGFASRKAEALLVYLACSGRPQSREVLADLFWDERSQAQALTNLRTVLASLRQRLAPYLLTDRQSIGLDPSNIYRLDVAELEVGLRRASDQHLETGRLSLLEAAELEQVLGLYRGDFLEGFSIHDSQGFEDWLLLERERLHHQVIDALHHLVASYVANGRYNSGIGQATRLLRLDPLREEAHRQLMLMLAKTGQRSAALTQYETCYRLLDEELGICPSKETTALYETIYSGTLAVEPAQVETTSPVLRNPYKGLRAFQETDAPDFFGREALIQMLLKRLNESGELSRFLALIGPSGSGKSSVVRAGLIPALRHGALSGSDHWLLADMYPGAYPLAELEAALLRIATNPPSSLIEQLREDENGILRAVKRVLPDSNTELLLPIDQFEEVFTLSIDESVRLHFLNSLWNAVRDPRSRVRVLITLRADFMDRPLRYADFGELIRQRSELVLPLSTEDMQFAITGPAKRVGLAMEPDLVAAVVRDVDEQPGALPLLQYALTELVERRDGNSLTLATYHASGGVLGALARRADELYSALDSAGQEAARQLFVRLVTPEDGTEFVRRRVRRSELASMLSEPRALDTVIDTYSNYRLLTFDQDPITHGPTLEIAHEALISRWGRLSQWLDESIEDLRMQRRLMAAAAEWRNAGQEASFLATGARLTQFETLTKESKLALNQEEREYVEASLGQETRRKARDAAIARRVQNFERATIILAIVGILSMIATGTAIWTANLVRQEVANATGLVESLRLAAAANTMLGDGKPETAALLSIRALENHYSIQADTALVQAIDQFHPQIALVQSSGVSSAAFSPDGTRLLVGTEDGAVALWDTTVGERLFLLKTAGIKVIAVVFSSDGTRLLAGSEDGMVWMWDAKTGQSILQFQAIAGSASSMAFSLDGSHLLDGDQAGIVWLWDVANQRQIQQITALSGPITALAFSPGGTRLLTAGGNGLLRLWDASNTRLLRQFAGYAETVYSVAFSPDGKFILTGADRTARLWDITKDQEIGQFVSQMGAVLSVAFSPDGKSVLTGGADRIVRLWDIESGLKSRQFVAHTGTISAVAFSPDGKTMMTGSTDNSVKLWNTDINDLIHYACNHLSRDFTDQERQQFLIPDQPPTCPATISGVSPTTP